MTIVTNNFPQYKIKANSSSNPLTCKILQNILLSLERELTPKQHVSSLSLESVTSPLYASTPHTSGHSLDSATAAVYALQPRGSDPCRGFSHGIGSTRFRGPFPIPHGGASGGVSSGASSTTLGNGGSNGFPSTSNSISHPAPSSYDVLLSFRGEDTRKTFTDHLYTAFVKAGLRTFRDDNELKRGENIKQEVMRTIKESKSSVIVFSKEYASSLWCLDELVMILHRKRTSNSDHVVLPVFYDVDPSEVRKQTGGFAMAFARHEARHPLDTIKRWRALTEAADLAGMVLQNEADGYVHNLHSVCS